MTTYMFGKSVTALEKAFLTNILVEPTRLEQGKHFNMIRNIAIKNDISMEKANEILEGKKRFVNGLNAHKTHSKELFTIDKYGNVIRRNPYTNRSEIIADDVYVSTKKKPQKHQKQPKILKIIKYCYEYLKEMFTVY